MRDDMCDDMDKMVAKRMEELRQGLQRHCEMLLEDSVKRAEAEGHRVMQGLRHMITTNTRGDDMDRVTQEQYEKLEAIQDDSELDLNDRLVAMLNTLNLRPPDNSPKCPACGKPGKATYGMMDSAIVFSCGNAECEVLDYAHQGEETTEPEKSVLPIDPGEWDWYDYGYPSEGYRIHVPNRADVDFIWNCPKLVEECVKVIKEFGIGDTHMGIYNALKDMGVTL